MTSQQVCSETFHPENPVKAFDSLAASGRPFFAYRLPDNDSITLGVGSLTAIDSYTGDRPAFAVAPFSPDRQAFVIEPSVTFHTPWIKPSTPLPPICVNDTPRPTNEYVAAIRTLTERLERRGGKTVIARTIDARADIDSLAVLFHTLCCRYPGSYVYCWSLDSNKFWIGAIPELLLRTVGENVESMALAGTMEADSDTPWSCKNLEEQQLVTEFIAATFVGADMTPRIAGPFDKPAGPVKHLCTKISATRPDSGFDALHFAAKLSPTPAVSGFPREDALRDIASIETIDREYYGGYSGPVTNRSHCEFYVTLRCMAIDTANEKITLYAGGGITHLSRPEDEWRETCLKASTLLSLFPSQK